MCPGITDSERSNNAGAGNVSSRPRDAKCCQVAGCMAELHTQAKPAYCLKRRLCHEHIKADAVTRKGHGPALWRYCFQCGKLEHLALFDGGRRNCRASLQQRREAARAKAGKAGAAWSRTQDELQPLLLSPQSSASDITFMQHQDQDHVAMQASGINLAGLLPGGGAACASPASCNTAEDHGLFDIDAAAEELAAAYCDFSGWPEQQLQPAQQEQARLCQILQVQLAAASQLPRPEAASAPTPAPAMMAVPANSFGPASAVGGHASSMFPGPPGAAAAMPQQHDDAFFNQLLDELLGQINAPTQPLACAAPHQPRAPAQAMALPATGIAPRRGAYAAQAQVMSRIAMLEQQCAELTSTLQMLQVMAQQGLL